MANTDTNQLHERELGYQQTMMYGRYTQSLGEYAKVQAVELRKQEKQRKKEEKRRIKELRAYRGKWMSRFLRVVSFIWRHTCGKIGEDWVFLALLGIIMAIISFTMDFGIGICNTACFLMFNELTTEPILQYFAWISLPVFLVLFSAGFVHLMAPQAIGSGMPEMKTILRGVVLKEYLTFRTFVAKVVGLTATLGSGMPLGKEGPLVHIASIVATLMSKMVTSFKGIYENESRNSEMLAAACAVGISCCFGAPIGGVLFSIEVTSVYFAIRNYWRGFCSAVFGAVMFRLLAYWFDTEETLTAIFRTNFRVEFAYDPLELFIYALIGVFGGLSGALFILCHRKYVLFMRNNQVINSFLQINRFIYPGIVSLFIATVYFPLGTGQFLASTLTTRQQITSLFSNFTWISDDLTVEQTELVGHWTSSYGNVLLSLSIYVITTFFCSLLASTLPVPSGSLIPIFKIGAAFGRIIGEAMNLWFPDGHQIGVASILPGGYAIVGAAAFSAGVTHSISICVVVSEMTGQIYHIIPILVAVLIANAISTLLQPSLYDSIIMIKKLPFLPDILPSKNAAHEIHVENFMVRNIRFIWEKMTHEELEEILKDNPKIHSFPLVQCPEQTILLGSIQRDELVNLIERQISQERRLKVAAERETTAVTRLKDISRLMVDTTPDELNEWEESEMQKPINFKQCHVDPAPFQLVERTSLLKVHSMFSLLGVHRAYVTTMGQLIGIVSLTELRKAIEDVNSGIIPNCNNHSAKGIEPLASPGSPIDLENGAETSSDSDSDSESDDSDDNMKCVATHLTVVHKSASLSSCNTQKSSSMSSFTRHYKTSLSSSSTSITAAITEDSAVHSTVTQQQESSTNEENIDSDEDHDSIKKHFTN